MRIDERREKKNISHTEREKAHAVSAWPVHTIRCHSHHCIVVEKTEEGEKETKREKKMDVYV